MSIQPEQLLYFPSHEWVHVTQEGADQVATIGISAFAVHQLTDLVFMALPKVGKTLSAGDEFGEVESVKSVNSLNCPVSGEVVAVNEGLVDQLEILSRDPYNDGWIIKVKMSDPSELSKLLDHASYEKQCAEGG